MFLFVVFSSVFVRVVRCLLLVGVLCSLCDVRCPWPVVVHCSLGVVCWLLFAG